MLAKIYRKLYKIVVGKINPVKYARKIGVNFKKGTLHIYGHVEFGSEPWLITFGENVYITDGVKFINHDGGTLIYRNVIPDLDVTKPITVGNDVYFGNNVIVLPGVTIGNNVVIGAGAVITKDIPDNCVVAGIPARVLKNTADYLEKISRESTHLGHLKGKKKDRELMKLYHYDGTSRGIYF